MRNVELEYDRRWREAGGIARLLRTASLYAAFREMLELQVRKKSPGLSDREVAIRAARRMYASDSATQKLLDQLETAPCTTSSCEQESNKSAESSKN
jgi:hypothetical protein